MTNDFDDKAKEIYENRENFLYTEWGNDCSYSVIDEDDFKNVISQALLEAFEAGRQSILENNK